MRKRQHLFIFILVVLLLLALDKSNLLQPVKDVVLTTLKPIQAPLYQLERNLANSFSIVGQVSKLNESNRHLGSENAALRAENEILKKLKEENTALTDQLKIKRSERQLIRAENYGTDPETRELLVKVTEPVEVGWNLILGENYIGRVTKINADFAKIQLPSDPDSKIPVITSGNVKGIATGRFRSEITLDKLLAEDKVTESELVRTTGEEGFLKDLVVGSITSIKSSERDLFKQAQVKPLVVPAEAPVFFVVRQ